MIDYYQVEECFGTLGDFVDFTHEAKQRGIRLKERNCARTPMQSSTDKRGVHRIILEPYGYRWYRVGGLGYLLDRSAPDRNAAK